MVVVEDDISLAVGQGRELVVVTYMRCGMKLEHDCLFGSETKWVYSYHWGSEERASAIRDHIRQRPQYPSCIYDFTHYQQQVDVIQPKALQALIQTLLNSSVVRCPHLCHNKHILALHTCRESLLEALANLVLVGIAVSAVDELVSVLERIRNGRLNLTGLGLPCSCKSRNLD